MSAASLEVLRLVFSLVNMALAIVIMMLATGWWDDLADWCDDAWHRGADRARHIKTGLANTVRRFWDRRRR
jgi:hypothetical protein